MDPKKKKSKRWQAIQVFFSSNTFPRFAILAIVMAVFTVVLYPNLVITEHNYQLGDVVTRDVKANRDFFFEDREATELNRRQAVKNVLTVYDFDDGMIPEISDRITLIFEKMRKYIEAEKQKLEDLKDADGTLMQKRMEAVKEEFEHGIGFQVNKAAYRLLVKDGFPVRITDLIVQVSKEIVSNGIVANKEFLLQEIESGVILRAVGAKTEQTVYTLRQFYGMEQAKTMVRVVAQPLVKDLDSNSINLIVDFCQRLIRPNITLNRHETEERKRKARDEINPVLYKVKAGEMLLRNGEVVTETQLMKLKALNERKKKDRIYVRNIGALLTILCMLLILYYLHTRRQRPILPIPNKDLLFLGIVVIGFICLPKLHTALLKNMTDFPPFHASYSSMYYGIPLSAGAMLVAIFLGVDMAAAIALVIAVCAAIIFQNRFDVFIFYLLNGLMATYWIQNCRERKVFIKAGLKLGGLNVILVFSLDLFMGDFSGLKLPMDLFLGFSGGVLAGILTAGLAPLIEISFGYTTDITLLELANLERPILRRLMLEAPGTYHHSVVVGSMVEAAAAEIGANPLLAKVCGYYHDIGKLKKPLYFVENQSGGANRHDKLAPSMSSLILISHVKHGVEIARENKLGQLIIDTIQQHHGTSLIKFFYEKAKQLKGDDNVKIEDFRYPGPRPQTREAGLVMLADAVEASSRTLENPTPSRIQGHVQKLINGIFSDGQLDNCELTLRDIHNIAKSFNKILNGIHHHRIEYPEKSTPSNGKEKITRTDLLTAKTVKDTPIDKDSRQLRRLGL